MNILKQTGGTLHKRSTRLRDYKKEQKNLRKVQNQTENFISRELDDGSFVDEDGDWWDDNTGPDSMGSDTFGSIILAIFLAGSCCICCGPIYFIWKSQTQQVIYQIFTIYY